MTLVAVFFLGLFAYGLLSRMLDGRGLTPQIVLLAAGLLLGAIGQGDGAIEVDVEWLHIAGEIALVLALFVDAARIDVGALRGSAGLPTRLLGIGLPLTILAGLAAGLLILPGLSVIDAVALAILVAPTDAALGAIVVTSPRVPVRIRQALNVESGLNDGLVTPLVLVAAAIARADETASQGGWIADAVRQIGLGVVAGIVVGVAGALLLRAAVRRGWILDGARWMVAPAMAMLAWFVAHALGGNVFVAAFVAGIAATATFGHVPEMFLEFAELAGELLGLVVFFLLGVIVIGLGIDDPLILLYAFASLTIVRMVPVAIAMVGTGLAGPTVAFVGWFGPRGLASIVLALVAIGDGSDGPPPFSPVVVAAVAVTVILSVLAHGLTAGRAVSRYGRFVDRLPPGSPEFESTTELLTRSGVVTRTPRPGASHEETP